MFTPMVLLARSQTERKRRKAYTLIVPIALLRRALIDLKALTGLTPKGPINFRTICSLLIRSKEKQRN
jgi:hypothetical protein